MSKYDDRRIWMNTGAQEKLKNLALEDATVVRTKKIYRQAAKDIEAQVEQIYNQIGTLAENGSWQFDGLNQPATRKDINALISAIEKAGLTDYVPEKLQRRMSVVQVKQMNIWLKIHESGEKSHELVKENLLKTMQNSGEIWKKAAGVGAESFVGFDRNICGYMMGMNWADGNFSSRLWNAGEETWEKVREELARAFANGQQPNTTKTRIRELLGGYYTKPTGLNYSVERIIRTESAKASTQADMVRWREMGVTKVQWNASFEKNTCEHCADRDGRIYDLNKILDEPPLHPNCRCYFTAYDEVAAQYPDTTYYKNGKGEYQEIQWAPYHAVIDEKGRLRSSPLKVSDYFWKMSPWTQYRAPKTGLKYVGETDAEVIDLAERTIKAITEEYPEIGERLESDFDKTITMHRGDSIIDGNKLAKVGGLTDQEKRQLTITYPDRATGGNPISQLAAEAKRQHARGFWSTDKDNQAIIHELGHVLAIDLKEHGIDLDDFIKDVAGTRNLKKALKIFKEEISGYAGKNSAEAFAEAFAKIASQDTSGLNKTAARFAEKLNEARATAARPMTETEKQNRISAIISGAKEEEKRILKGAYKDTETAMMMAKNPKEAKIATQEQLEELSALNEKTRGKIAQVEKTYWKQKGEYTDPGYYINEKTGQVYEVVAQWANENGGATKQVSYSVDAPQTLENRTLLYGGNKNLRRISEEEARQSVRVGDTFKGINKRDEIAIKTYTQLTPQNESLRKGVPIEEIKSAKDLQEIIKRTNSAPGEYWRGFRDTRTANEIAALKVGDSYGDKGFMSTSRDKTKAEEFAELGKSKVLLRIKSKGGYGKSINVAPYSEYTDEAEELFAAGTRGVVVSKEKRNGWTIVTVEV